MISAKIDRGCAFPGCERRHHKAGYCTGHYLRRKKHGDPSVGGPLRAIRGLPRQWLVEHAAYQGDACLIWPFSRHDNGYGQMAGGSPHRRMCELAHGKAPSPEHEAAHSCGNGAGGCVHPGHLRWATRLENAADRELHGTLMRGERSPGAKLSQADVDQIRVSYAAGGVSHRKLAARFGVSQSQVSRILAGKRWFA